MRIPLTPYGRREIAAGSGLCVLLGALCLWLWPPLVVAPAAALVFLLSFFRDPQRPCRAADGELLSPADGTVADVAEVAAPVYLQGRALRVGVFMSVFNCHVNRAPAEGVVELVEHHSGSFLDARDGRAIAENEHGFLGIRCADGRRILVKQVAGLIARRIVCAVGPGDRLDLGRPFGMVKFGSRLELWVPVGDGPVARVKVGDRVKAGRDVLIACGSRAQGADGGKG